MRVDGIAVCCRSLAGDGFADDLVAPLIVSSVAITIPGVAQTRASTAKSKPVTATVPAPSAQREGEAHRPLRRQELLQERPMPA